MREQSKENAREKQIFEEYPVGKALSAMVLPTIVSQIIFVAYNMADTWYVGLTNNKNAVAAVSLCLPVYTLLSAISNLYGIGGASVIARALGTNDREKARRTFALSFFLALITAAFYGLLIFLTKKPLLLLIGGDSGDIQDAVTYAVLTITIGGIPTILATTFGHLIRATGHPKAASFGMILGAVLNIGLDPLFMFVLLPKGHEVAGAAAATALSNVIGCLYFALYMYRNRESNVYQILPRRGQKNARVAAEILRGGLPGFCMTFMAMLSNCFLNSMLSTLGSAAIAGLGIVRKIDQLAYAVNQGITQGMLPLVAYCYAARLRARTRKVIWYSAVCSELFSLLCMVLSLVFAPELVSLFIREPETIAYGAAFLRVLCLAIPVYTITFVVIAVLQAGGFGKEPFFLSILHKGTLDIALMFLLARRLGVSKIIWASPISETAAMLVSVYMLARFLKYDKE